MCYWCEKYFLDLKESTLGLLMKWDQNTKKITFKVDRPKPIYAGLLIVA